MGIGDEIMALGRADRHYRQTGRKCKIVNDLGVKRDHDTWVNSKSISPTGCAIKDGAGCRPYLLSLSNGKSVFNTKHTARAGFIELTDGEWTNTEIPHPPYAVISPQIKKGATQNKTLGVENWETIIKYFPCPVYQLDGDLINGAISFKTNTIRHAVAVISGAAVVLCNEGGTHHMAGSHHVPAVVYFGAFIPPSVTGYGYHHNISVETNEGYCGNWGACKHCDDARKSVDLESIRQKAVLMLEAWDAD